MTGSPEGGSARSQMLRIVGIAIAIMISAGMKVHVSSSFVLPWVCFGISSSERLR